jgi:ribonuclease HII
MLLPFHNENELEACLDEAGLGCLAGPVYAAAVIWPHPDTFEEEHQSLLKMLNDSKKLTHKKRLQLKEFIEHYALDYHVATVNVEEIDKINIYNARFKAMHNAIRSLTVKPESLLVDGNKFVAYIDPDTDEVIPHTCIVKGDGKYQGIAAASILAKVARDQYMDTLHEQYPMYGWNKNKGYGTKAHYDAIKEHGPVPPHRMSYNLHLTEGDEETLPDH